MLLLLYTQHTYYTHWLLLPTDNYKTVAHNENDLRAKRNIGNEHERINNALKHVQLDCR